MCGRQLSHLRSSAHNERVSFVARRSSNDVWIRDAVRDATLGMSRFRRDAHPVAWEGAT
jgi:hypothetical protein